jgi:2-keto-3-deoxy-L-rhamnonate aldolase RhmA
MSFETLQQMVWAADAVGITPFARVSDGQRTSVLRALECGVQGILMPWCETAEAARQFVDHARYKPQGRRGAYGNSYASGYLRRPATEAWAAANEELMVMVQIESPEAAARTAEIAGVEGIDAVMVGPGDLSVQLDHPMDFDHPAVLGAIDRVVAETFAAGKQPALLDMTPAFTQRYMEQGVKLWWWGQDLNFLRLQLLSEAGRLRTEFGWTPIESRLPGNA